MLLVIPGADAGQEPDPLSPLVADSVAIETADSEAVAAPSLRADSLARETTTQAQRAFRELWIGFVRSLPKLAVAVLVFFVAWLLVRVTRPVLRRVLGRWERADAATALFGIGIWLLAVGVVLSVIAGDFRALLGSLGLVGLALSWALQTPIESFTGWLLNSFQGYYRVGDRIAVGDVFGDVYQIDFLTTTVWEFGGLDHPPPNIRAEQPTGRLITFPNNEVLTGSIINYTRDFDFVWDELAVSVASESDLRYAAEQALRVARDLLGSYMETPARQYAVILRRAGLPDEVPEEPQLYFAITDSGVDLVLRYLVGARERRKWKSEFAALVTAELNRPEHAGKILPVYPRRQVQLVQPDGSAAPWRSEPPPGDG